MEYTALLPVQNSSTALSEVSALRLIALQGESSFEDPKIIRDTDLEYENTSVIKQEHILHIAHNHTLIVVVKFIQ
jgi:hypothetical protein